MIFRTLDIETVDDAAAWSRGEPRYQIVAAPNCVHPDGSPLVTVQSLDVFPPPHACRVVAISCVDVGFDPSHDPKYWLESCWTDCRWARPMVEADVEEAALLSAFGHAMETAFDIHFVTWNGRTFDLPVIVLRSLKHKISTPWYYKSRDVRYRYSTEGHLDLMDFLSDYGATRFMKLGDVARLCGLPGKTDMSGDQVAVLWGKAMANPLVSDELRARVARYCLQDTIQTALLFVRTLHQRGKIAPETHDAVVETFRTNPEILRAIEIDWDRLMLSGRKT